MILIMTLWKRQNNGDSKKDVWLPEAGGGGEINRQRAEDFQGSGNTI